jgi:DNA-binding MarR family transcriptional regulator
MNQMSGGHKPGLTPTQGQYLAFIDAYTRVNLKPPAEADIQRRFGVTPPSVHQMVLALERAGLIRRQPGTARSIELLVPPENRIPPAAAPARRFEPGIQVFGLGCSR